MNLKYFLATFCVLLGLVNTLEIEPQRLHPDIAEDAALTTVRSKNFNF